MPGSLLSRVRRSNSARSDRSDISAKSGDSCKSSGKKVSFNKAVRVKKFPRRTDALLHDDTEDADEKRFWFRVYKNEPEGSQRRDLVDPSSGWLDDEASGALRSPLEPIAEIPRIHDGGQGMRLTTDVGVGTSGDALHSSQQSETPTVRRNHVRKLVTRFNEEAVLKFPEEDDSNGRPPEPPVDYSEETKRRNPFVNGVKVIFGNFKSKRNEGGSLKPSSVVRKNQTNLKKSLLDSKENDEYESGPPYKTSIVLADEYARVSNNNNIYANYNNNLVDERYLSISRENSYLIPAAFWNSGDQLVSDTSRFESSFDQTDQGGEVHRTVEEGNRVWKNETRTIYEEESTPILAEQRRAKSHGDLRGDTLDNRLPSMKGLSIEDLPNQRRRSLTRDRGVQCNRSRESSTLPEYHRVIRPSRDGFVSAYSDVPTIRASKANGTMLRSRPATPVTEAIYSQVDKNKKLLGKKSASSLSLNSRSPGSKVKSSQKSFGFRLKKAFGATLPEEKGNSYVPAKDEDGNWYDVDADVEAASQRSRGHRYISEVGVEIDGERKAAGEVEATSSREPPGSVVKGVDHRKKEICYENTVTRNKPEPRLEAGGGLWYRGAEEDYRREMAQSDVSYPSGTHVGSTSTLGRALTTRAQHSASSNLPKAHTLDRRHFRSKSPINMNGSAVKILVNGQEIDEADDCQPQHRRTPSGEGRGGLAAAYKARQKAALKRSNSLSGSRLSVSGLSSGASSSGGAGSDGELSRRRRTLVMYIPGVQGGSSRGASESDDRRSGVSRTQSLHTASRPPKYQKHVRKGAAQNSRYLAGKVPEPVSEEADTLSPLRSDTKSRKGDLRRRHSMPKDTKFSWFKWKIRGKNREA